MLWDFFFFFLIPLCFLTAAVRKSICSFPSVKLMLAKDVTNIFFPYVYQACEFKQQLENKTQRAVRSKKKSLLFRFQSSRWSWCGSAISSVCSSSPPPPLPRRKYKGTKLTLLLVAV